MSLTLDGILSSAETTRRNIMPAHMAGGGTGTVSVRRHGSSARMHHGARWSLDWTAIKPLLMRAVLTHYKLNLGKVWEWRRRRSDPEPIYVQYSRAPRWKPGTTAVARLSVELLEVDKP